MAELKGGQRQETEGELQGRSPLAWMAQVLIPRRNQMHVRIFKVRNLTACGQSPGVCFSVSQEPLIGKYRAPGLATVRGRQKPVNQVLAGGCYWLLGELKCCT